MENAVRLYAIGELLGKDFFVPAYQRGYRWDKQQVTDLLDDISGFANKKNKSPEEFYCLQPVVVRPHVALPDDQNSVRQVWEVVDGQQRLTTLKIIFQYLIRAHLRADETFESEYKSEVFRLQYETRSSTKGFLEQITEGNKDCIDHYYISQAYTHIKRWFEGQTHSKSARESIIRTLVGTPDQQKAEGIVKVIWYELAETENPIESFTRINLGKIPLTNSELIKALFLQTRDFGPNNDLGKLRQLEIASEWDRIENRLQNDGFWWFLNKEDNKAGARIEFVFDTIRKLECLKNSNLVEQIGTDGYATFRLYYQRANADNQHDFVKQEWANVVARFNQLLEWYEDREWYHYVGFLIHCGERVESLLDLYSIPTRESITTALKDRIRTLLLVKQDVPLQWKNEEDGKAFLSLGYAQKDLVRKVLLLFNLQETIRQGEASDTLVRFSFKAYRQQKWDIEHIDSSSQNPLLRLDEQQTWLQAAMIDLPQLGNQADLKQRITDFLAAKENEAQEEFHLIHQEVVELVAGEDLDDAPDKDNIGNLTLLDAGTNRSFGNALFITKRKRIIKNDSEGMFIPPCTKNVFLKYFDQQGIFTTSWGADDIRAHRDQIAYALADFLPAKPNDISV